MAWNPGEVLIGAEDEGQAAELRRGAGHPRAAHGRRRRPPRARGLRGRTATVHQETRGPSP